VNRNLFGETQTDPVLIKLDRRHPDIAGTGPQGETCGTCEHLARIEYHNRTYRKCEKMRGRWTHGPGTDVRAKDPACRWWQKSLDGHRDTISVSGRR
jgi:hypothetical protein